MCTSLSKIKENSTQIICMNKIYVIFLAFLLIRRIYLPDLSSRFVFTQIYLNLNNWGKVLTLVFSIEFCQELKQAWQLYDMTLWHKCKLHPFKKRNHVTYWVKAIPYCSAKAFVTVLQCGLGFKTNNKKKNNIVNWENKGKVVRFNKVAYL